LRSFRILLPVVTPVVRHGASRTQYTVLARGVARQPERVRDDAAEVDRREDLPVALAQLVQPLRARSRTRRFAASLGSYHRPTGRWNFDVRHSSDQAFLSVVSGPRTFTRVRRSYWSVSQPRLMTCGLAVIRRPDLVLVVGVSSSSTPAALPSVRRWM
jgi:hypothetical protein